MTDVCGVAWTAPWHYPKTPTYYCGALHKFINIPSRDFPDFKSVKAKCDLQRRGRRAIRNGR